MACPGEVIASSPQEVAEAMRSNGFFGYSSQRQRHAAAVLLLRLLAWKRVNTVVQERQALRSVTVARPPALLTCLPLLPQRLLLLSAN